EIKLVELSNKTPERIAVEIRELDAKQITELAELPVQLTGLLSGSASLNEWSLTETRWADLELRGAATDTAIGEFGALNGRMEYRNQRLTYELNGELLDGKVSSSGSTAIQVTDLM